MKRIINSAAILATLIGTLFVAVGCGGSGNGTAASSGLAGGPTTFQGVSIRNDFTYLVGGSVNLPYYLNNTICGVFSPSPTVYQSGYYNPYNPNGNYNQFGQYLNLGVGQFQVCYNFNNNSLASMYPGANAPITAAAVGVPMYQADRETLFGISEDDPGSSITISAQNIGNGQANIVGTIALSPQFLANNAQAFPAGIASITGYAINFWKRSPMRSALFQSGTVQFTPIDGAVLIYTNSPTTAGAFLPIVKYTRWQ